MTTRQLSHALSLAFAAIARLPRMVWAILLGGMFILSACATPATNTPVPTEDYINTPEPTRSTSVASTTTIESWEVDDALTGVDFIRLLTPEESSCIESGLANYKMLLTLRLAFAVRVISGMNCVSDDDLGRALTLGTSDLASPVGPTTQACIERLFDDVPRIMSRKGRSKGSDLVRFKVLGCLSPEEVETLGKNHYLTTPQIVAKHACVSRALRNISPGHQERNLTDILAGSPDLYELAQKDGSAFEQVWETCKVFYATTTPPLPKSTGGMDAVGDELIGQVRDAVVTVESAESSGSGFIVAQKGENAYVVTNLHVVDGEDDNNNRIDGQITVITSDGRRFEAYGVGQDSYLDVAALSICCDESFAVIPWDSGREANIGDQVVALSYEGSNQKNLKVATGKIVEDPSANWKGNLGHDAFLNPGNSGSPLLAWDGSLLGINVGISTLSDNVSFAIPYSSVSENVRGWIDRSTVLPAPAPFPQEECIYGFSMNSCYDGPGTPLTETVDSAGFTFICEDLLSEHNRYWALNDYLAHELLAIFMMEVSNSLDAGVIISAPEAIKALNTCRGRSFADACADGDCAPPDLCSDGTCDPGNSGGGGGGTHDPGNSGGSGGGLSCDPGDPSCRWGLDDDEDVASGSQEHPGPEAESPQDPASRITAGLPDTTYTPIGWGLSGGSPNDPPPVGKGVVGVEIGGDYFLCNDIGRRHLSDARIIAQTDLDRDLVFHLLAGYMMVLPYVEVEIPGPDISPEEAEQAWNTCEER